MLLTKNISANSSKLEVYNLTCNYLKNPMGVETPNPLFSWMLQSNEKGVRQIAYRIVAASSQGLFNTGMYDLWDSEKVESDRSIHVPYGGKPLKSRGKVFWKVCVWDSSNSKSDWSETATFEMGLLKKRIGKQSGLKAPGEEQTLQKQFLPLCSEK